MARSAARSPGRDGSGRGPHLAFERNKALFKLSSTTGLALASDSELTGIDAHAVSLQQTFNGLAASGGGLVTLGVTKVAGGWSVVSASSTINGDETLAGTPKLKAEQAWQARCQERRGAATYRCRQVHRARAAKDLRGWKSLKVAGIGDVQRARGVAFPTVVGRLRPGVRVDRRRQLPAEEPLAYRVFTDARSGKVLARDSLVDIEAAAAAAKPPTFNFSGEVPPTDGACDTLKGPYTAAADAGVRAIDVFASADVPLDDIVLNLFRGTTLVAQADTLTYAGRIRYEPDGRSAGRRLLRPGVRLRGGPRRLDRPADLHRHRHAPTTPRRRRPTWRAGTSSRPIRRSARFRRIHGTARAPTREQEWCWKQSTNAADCSRVIGNLASRTPWDVRRQGRAAKNTTWATTRSRPRPG